jgi:hypothetical protein
MIDRRVREELLFQYPVRVEKRELQLDPGWPLIHRATLQSKSSIKRTSLTQGTDNDKLKNAQFIL